MKTDEQTELLREMYVWISIKHRAGNPWRNAFDVWQKKVEQLTGWDSFSEIEKWRKEHE
jgi:hypothetical protein